MICHGLFGIVSAVQLSGLIPMALSPCVGAEVQRPLDTVVIGGLVSATFLTLFVIPTVYAFVYRREEAQSSEQLTSKVLGQRRRCYATLGPA